jgi:hypothetical protein
MFASRFSLYFIPKNSLNNQLLFPIGVAFGLALVAAFYCFKVRKKYGWSKKIDWLLNLNCRVGEYIIPWFSYIIVLPYGQEGMKTAILVDQPGTF